LERKQAAQMAMSAQSGNQNAFPDPNYTGASADDSTYRPPLTTNQSAYSRPEPFCRSSEDGRRQITWNDIQRDLHRQQKTMRDHNLYTATDGAYRELFERGLLKIDY